MNRTEAQEAAESLQNLLIARATGGGGSDVDYRELRDTLRGDVELRDLLPTYVRTSRDLSQFWAYIQKQSGGYKERREHIWATFAPLLEYLDAEPPAEQPPPPRYPIATTVPEGEPKLQRVRAFISYSTVDKEAAGAVKRALSTFGIDCFLAHEDIHVSEEWRERILEELATCTVFIPLLSQAFKESDWAPQEIGAIAARADVAVVPLSLDGRTIPFGFIAKIQGGRVPLTGVDPETILEPLTTRFPRVVIPGLIARVRDATSYRSAETAMRPVVKHFANLSDSELRSLVRASIENRQVWSAADCRAEFLPQLVELNRSRIDPTDLVALEYQIENNERYVNQEP